MNEDEYDDYYAALEAKYQQDELDALDDDRMYLSITTHVIIGLHGIMAVNHINSSHGCMLYSLK